MFGRGTKFICKDNKLDDNGGVHIIQTFLSLDPSEQIQVRGRTARQGKKGAYQLLLLVRDLKAAFGDTNVDQLLRVARDCRREELNNMRLRRCEEQNEQRKVALETTERRDELTHA